MTINYIIWDVDPVIFSVGTVSIRWYPILLFAGIFTSYLILRKIFREESVPLKTLDSYGVYILLALFIGGRLVHCLVYEPAYYLKFPLDIIKPWRGELGNGARFTGIRGMSGHGAAAAILLALILNARRTHTPVLWIFDRMAIFGPLVGFFIRLGNLFNSEILGVHSNLPWAFIFRRVNNMPRHPAQLYEALTYLLIFVIAYLFFRRNRKSGKEGATLGLVLVLVYVTRIFLEFVKEPQTQVESGRLLNYGQLLSLPFVVLGLILIIRSYRKMPEGKSTE
jgi:prolipoprotein diacylglyceryl transferase